MEREEFSFWIIKLEMIDLLVVLFFFSLKKKEPKNSRRKKCFSQGRHPHPHFSPCPARPISHRPVLVESYSWFFFQIRIVLDLIFRDYVGRP
jgi:hypothetical protein